MIEFIEGLVIGVLVTLFTIFAIKWEKTVQKNKQIHTPVTQRSYEESAVAFKKANDESQARLRRLELGSSPTELSK